MGHITHLNKRPMSHIAHLRKHFKSINTNDYIITLIKRRKKNIINFMRIYWFFIWTWIPFTQGFFGPSFVEIGPVVLEKMKMWKVYRQTDRQTTEDRWSEKLTWAFSSGELKTFPSNKQIWVLTISDSWSKVAINFPWKRIWPLIWVNWNPLTQGCFLLRKFVPCLVVIGSMVEKIAKQITERQMTNNRWSQKLT